SILDARGDGHLQLLLEQLRAAALALLAGRADHLPLAVAGGAGGGDHQEALRVDHLAAPAALGAALASGTGSGAGAAAHVAGVAVGVQLERELAVGALERGRVGVARNSQDVVIVVLIAHRWGSGTRSTSSD